MATICPSVFIATNHRLVGAGRRIRPKISLSCYSSNSLSEENRYPLNLCHPCSLVLWTLIARIHRIILFIWISNSCYSSNSLLAGIRYPLNLCHPCSLVLWTPIARIRIFLFIWISNSYYSSNSLLAGIRYPLNLCHPCSLVLWTPIARIHLYYSVSIGLAFRVAVAGGYADPPLRYRGFEMAPSISENGVLRQGKRRIGETKPMELLNEINGIVRQNQWNRWTKSMVLFLENGRLDGGKRQNDETKATN